MIFPTVTLPCVGFSKNIQTIKNETIHTNEEIRVFTLDNSILNDRTIYNKNSKLQKFLQKIATREAVVKLTVTAPTLIGGR